MTQQSARTYRGALDDATRLLFEGSDTPRIDAELLMQHVIGRPLAWLIAYGDTVATADHTREFYTAIAERKAGKPIAYITGSRDFWTLNLRVNEHVLIPRPDTETLVEHALERVPHTSACQLLDLGTGSGAIALSLAQERPNAQVLAVDFSADALEVAKTNAEHNNVHNVSFAQGSWFDPLHDNTKFNLIASNPPYVEAGDAHLEQGDLRFEPDMALIAESDGLSDLRTIISTAPNYLVDQGWLIVEHGFAQADAVASLFKAENFINIELFKDINQLPRCTAGRLA